MENNSIYTIPVTDIFATNDGCPFCRLKSILEDRCVKYITGAAMMEPEIRMKTNEQGFCNHHLSLMYQQKNKLAVALILQSHLEHLQSFVFRGGMFINSQKQSKKAEKSSNSCYVCNKTENAFQKISENAVRLFFEDSEFKEMYLKQEYICLPHLSVICDISKKVLKPKESALFMKHTEALCENYLKELSDDVTHFTKMFDYRNANGDWKNSKDSIERTIKFLTSKDLF